MGTAVSVVFIGTIMFFVGGGKIKHIMYLLVVSIPAFYFAVISEPYRLKRIMSFLNPWADPKGTGFQIIQSFIALGSGGMFGVGLGGSKQKLFYLPESHTDFVFAIIGEETGFLGASIVLILFAVLIYLLFRIAVKLQDIYASLLVTGLGVMIAFEVIVNIGVSTGTLPTKGLPLPFISYGGSSLVSHLMAMGLIFNMSKRVE